MTVGMTMMMTMNGMTDLAVLVFCEFSTCLSSDVCFNPMNCYTVTLLHAMICYRFVNCKLEYSLDM